MTTRSTRTVNPLPFQDLEPHRFEDLVRQLAYDFRPWKSLEATGQGGSDGGLDIRGVDLARLEVEQSEDSSVETIVEERLWTFQCKREKAFGPTKVVAAVEEALSSFSAPPHGCIVAVACDVSRKAREAFRAEMVRRGIKEFAIWARSELEDMLFQAENDHLLFAHFGLSLQPRQRSLATAIRSELSMKKQLKALLDDHDYDGRLVLLRDPEDTRYPEPSSAGEPVPKWLACRLRTLMDPGQARFLHHEYLAAATPDVTQWDAILSNDTAAHHARNELVSNHAWAEKEERDVRKSKEGDPFEFWREYIPEQDRAHLKVWAFLPLNRIIAIDTLGDGFYPIPHILVTFGKEGSPFTAEMPTLDRADTGSGEMQLRPTKENRASLFPRVLPIDSDDVPAGFDHTGESEASLTAPIKEKLAAVLGALAARRKPSRIARPDHEETPARPEDGFKAFLEWRDRIAHPLCASIVQELRRAGHVARVCARTVKLETTGVSKTASIELRVRLGVKGMEHTWHQPQGHLRVSFWPHGAWGIEIKPDAKESRGTSLVQRLPAPDEGITAERLEELVLLLLTRLQSE